MKEWARTIGTPRQDGNPNSSNAGVIVDNRIPLPKPTDNSVTGASQGNNSRTGNTYRAQDISAISAREVMNSEASNSVGHVDIRANGSF